MLKRRIAITVIFLTILFISLFFGSIPPSPLYYLKITRESIQNLFIFGDEDKAHWLLTKAEKRIAEAERLKLKNLIFFHKLQVNKAKEYQSEAHLLLEKLKNKTNINYLLDIYNQNNDRLKVFEGK